MSDTGFEDGTVDGDLPPDPVSLDALGYASDNPLAGLAGVVNDRRLNNPVRRSRPAGR